MKPIPFPLFASAILIFCSPMNSPAQTALGSLAHVRNAFSLIVHAPYSEAAPLFGPNGERGWAGAHWDPQFFYPQPGRDIQGAVFSIHHGSTDAVWVNTLFDIEAHRFQYVYFIPEALVTVIDVNFTPIDGHNTKVDVLYTRTALDAEANEHVRSLGAADSKSGPQWEKSINDYLEKQKH